MQFVQVSSAKKALNILEPHGTERAKAKLLFAAFLTWLGWGSIYMNVSHEVRSRELI